ncbi:hypothetical protein [Clostridium botulinum]|uniref:hypothetical protein n=1 Tax=Clostridium botulinum TaxID=1491 RepID=UPI0006A74DD0|nr:hypothetical protein [Clostridium botulinum]KAI3350150.1 hypothetical protein CIT18_04535 [Clostridium botulinum]KOM88964.1 hypothetical protein ACP51_04320 [Clostridium botulinum]KOR63530.1 hypothetical protein ADT22_03105 [Clostridium botulinum]MCS6111546.1 hypothetical protein [Clostridium botulinum]NFE10966.1 hypothetical protein [Clostridium botulinum]
MIEKEAYMNIVMRMMKYKNNEYEDEENKQLESDDFIIMVYLFGILDNEKPIEVKNSRISEITKIPKKFVKNSIKRLVELGILVEVNDRFNFGLKIGNCLDFKEENELIKESN